MQDRAMTIRPVARRVQGVPASDGAGVRLTRVIGTRILRVAAGRFEEIDP